MMVNPGAVLRKPSCCGMSPRPHFRDRDTDARSSRQSFWGCSTARHPHSAIL